MTLSAPSSELSENRGSALAWRPGGRSGGPFLWEKGREVLEILRRGSGIKGSLEVPHKGVGTKALENRRIPPIRPDQKVSVPSKVRGQSSDGFLESLGFVDMVTDRCEDRPDPDVERVPPDLFGPAPYRAIDRSSVSSDRNVCSTTASMHLPASSSVFSPMATSTNGMLS